MASEEGEKMDRNMIAVIGVTLTLIIQTLAFGVWLGRISEGMDTLKTALPTLVERVQYLERNNPSSYRPPRDIQPGVIP